MDHIEHGLRGVNRRTVGRIVGDVFEVNRQAADMVHVGMGEKDVADTGLLGRRAVQAEAASIHGDDVVDQQGGQVLDRSRPQRGRDEHDLHTRPHGVPPGVYPTTGGRANQESGGRVRREETIDF
jgi:hypothetical protein